MVHSVTTLKNRLVHICEQAGPLSIQGGPLAQLFSAGTNARTGWPTIHTWCTGWSTFTNRLVNICEPPCTYSEPPCTYSEPPCTYSEPPCTTFTNRLVNICEPPCTYSEPPCTYSEPPCMHVVDHAGQPVRIQGAWTSLYECTALLVSRPAYH
jgi:hypothetical protein